MNEDRRQMKSNKYLINIHTTCARIPQRIDLDTALLKENYKNRTSISSTVPQICIRFIFYSFSQLILSHVRKVPKFTKSGICGIMQSATTDTFDDQAHRTHVRDAFECRNVRVE